MVEIEELSYFFLEPAYYYLRHFIHKRLVNFDIFFENLNTRESQSIYIHFYFARCRK